jgi:hypothetical protein
LAATRACSIASLASPGASMATKDRTEPTITFVPRPMRPGETESERRREAEDQLLGLVRAMARYQAWADHDAIVAAESENPR